MKEQLLEIINHYRVMPQLKYFQSEVWELNEAIICTENDEYNYYEEVETSNKNHIAEELADNFVMLYQFPEYYYQRLECHNIEPYNFKTDNYENIDNILEYLKKFQKDICKLTCEIAIAEEREQDYIVECRYEDLIEKVDVIAYKLKSIQYYYDISDKQIEDIMKFKIERQLRRIEKGE